ncbi:MAG: hypothetical protein HQM08_26140 [Candidatus Riflebacteria bacterium]|nr:hypothetical protein [Candidatus Riflebacteria bacterium]
MKRIFAVFLIGFLTSPVWALSNESKALIDQLRAKYKTGGEVAQPTPQANVQPSSVPSGAPEAVAPVPDLPQSALKGLPGETGQYTPPPETPKKHKHHKKGGKHHKKHKHHKKAAKQKSEASADKKAESK